MGSCYSKGQKEMSKYKHQERGSNWTLGSESIQSEPSSTCQVSEDEPEHPASAFRKVFDEKQLEVKQEIAAVTSHPLPSVEELLRYYNRALQEERNRVIVLESQLSVGGATGQQQQEVKAKEKTDKGQSEKINVPVETKSTSRCVAETQTETTGGVGALWTSKELLDLVREAPDPFTKPMDFYRWLRQTCLVYEPRPVQVRKLLRLVFEPKWQKFEEYFHVPGSDTDSDWSGVAMTTWLDITFKKSVVSVAEMSPNNSFSYHQKLNESMTDFLPRFQQMINSFYDEDYAYRAILKLMMCLQPHVAEQFQQNAIEWSSFTFERAASWLQWMENKGMFEAKVKPLAKLQSGQWEEEEEEEEEEEKELNAPSHYYPHFKRRRGRCYSCGRWGHWARECRASFPIQLEKRSLEWTYVD